MTDYQKVIATIVLNKKGNPEIVAGRQTPLHVLHMHVTERMLMDMNAMMRDKWEQARKALLDDLDRQQYPRTINESF